jgi:uncharacterized protein YidB (DUF937 family)
MGLLDSLLQSGAVGSLAKNVVSNPSVIAAVTSFLSPDDNSVGANNGGLGGILNTLRDAGLGKAADSWVGSGANEAISPEQLEAALGGDTVRQFAQRAGVEERQSAGVLADLLPELINQMTPRGQVPQGNDLSGLLKQLIS